MINLFKISSAVLFSAVAGLSTAQPILPDTSGFGPLPGATFGSPTSSIPNTAVAQTTQGGVTLGLSATQRFSNPALSNDGAGSFFALAGIDTNAPSPANPYALWNFNYAILGASTATSAFNYRLYYDFNPAAGNDISTHGYFSLLGLSLNTSQLSPSQNSLNLGMDILTPPTLTNPFGNPTAPVGSTLSTFNPNAVGEYTFKLAAYTPTGQGLSFNAYGSEAFSTSMVVSAIPEPGEWAMMLAGLGVVSAIARRRRNK
jgi:hypothetical protein